MTRGNRIIAILTLLGVLMPGLGLAGGSQGGTSTTDTGKSLVISGTIGVAGVRLEGSPTGPGPLTDENGVYRFEVRPGWSGTIKPVKPGYSFTPASREYTAVTANRNDENYTAEPRMVIISDVLSWDDEPLQGVKITADPGGYSAVTDRNGRYTVEVPYGWSGKLILFAEDAEDIGPFTNVTSDIIDIRRVLPPEKRMVTISDRVAFNGEPIESVEVTAEPGEYSAVTDARGRYSIKVPYGWSGRLTMSKPGFAFESQAEYGNITADIVDGKSIPAAEDWPPLPSGIPQAGAPISTSDVLVIPTREPAAKGIAETTEDMRVMLHILREKLSEPRMILGVLRDYGSFFDQDRKAEAFYLQGTAAVFVIQVDFPYSFSTQPPAEGEAQKEAVDPVWQRARQKLYSPTGSRSYTQPGQTQQMTFEQFRDELLRSLRHAANLRHIEPNELIVLTVVSQHEEAGWSGAAVSGGVGGGSFPYGRGGAYGGSRAFSGGSGYGRSGTAMPDGRGKPRLYALGDPAGQEPAPPSTVLTMQAKKADIDAFAGGDLDFEQFRQRVKSFMY